MKLTFIIFTTFLAVASVQGSAVADPDPRVGSWHGYCYRAGEPCSKLKRAAEAAAKAVTDPEGCDSFSDEHYSKAKRDALALAEATAEALAAADPEAQPCHAPGAPCSIAKREALDACEKAPLVQRSHGGKSWHGYCWRAGEPCSKLKRAAEEVAEAIAQPIRDSDAESESRNEFCSPGDERCSKQKRALDNVHGLLSKILLP